MESNFVMTTSTATPSNTIQAAEERPGTTSDSLTPLLSPASIGLLTLMAGPHISLFPGVQVLLRLSIGKMAILPLLFAALLFLGFYGCLLFWPVRWYWTSLVLLAAHLICATLYYFIFRKLHKSHPKKYHTEFPSDVRIGASYVFKGICGGVVFLPLLGMAFVLLFLLGVDRLLFTLMPVAFDDSMSLSLLVFGIVGLAITGGVAGGWVGKLGLRLRPLQFITGSFGLIWIALLWFLFLQLLVILPGFLTNQLGYDVMMQPYFFFVIGNFFIGSWWSAYLLLYALRPLSGGGRGFRFLQIPCISFSSALIFVLLCGYPSNWFYSLGMFFEKEGKVAQSLWCYEHGMSKKPSGIRASYLQYRIALMAHKLGDREKAMDGFRKVISMYNYSDRLVRKSSKFLNNIERNGDVTRRVVLPGVENPTTFKGAYCVPNSLALVMNFWGAGVDADSIGETITSLNSGTMVVDQAWYAEKMGFRHEFMPLATFTDIKNTIDAGFPVLVYVPAHVFVIVGYDDVLETFVTYDVATRDIWVDYLRKDFIKSWKKEDTTMVVVYPPDQEQNLPPEVHRKLTLASNKYLQYHLHYLDGPEGYPSMDHLLEASRSSGTFFLPLITAYSHFPSQRKTLAKTHDMEGVVETIFNYFQSDYDEGAHLAGQVHYDDYASEDKKLQASLSFLIGTGQLQAASRLIEEIDTTGELSEETRKLQAMVDLAQGDFSEARLRLSLLDDAEYQFYLAQSYLKDGDTASAVPGLVKTIDNCT